jgi:Virus neck protein
MPTNPYFQSGIPMGRRSEQVLYEDLIIECLKIYGFDVWYIPRKKFSQDLILNEDVLNTYEHAYPIEMYMENIQGFEGEGELLSKFGVEIRENATFVVSRRRWNQLVKRFNNTILERPAEGDIIYFPLTNSLFEIRKTIGNQPFYQAGALYVFKLSCELMEYSLERFDTGVEEIDKYPDTVIDTLTSTNYNFQLMSGDNLLLQNEDFLVTMDYNPDSLTYEGTEVVISQNSKFDTDIEGILDFTEKNPFGEVYRA